MFVNNYFFSYFDIFQSKIESINSILGELHQEIRSVNTEHGNVDQVIKYANEQISHTLQKYKLETECQWRSVFGSRSEWHSLGEKIDLNSNRISRKLQFLAKTY